MCKKEKEKNWMKRERMGRRNMRDRKGENESEEKISRKNKIIKQRLRRRMKNKE